MILQKNYRRMEIVGVTRRHWPSNERYFSYRPFPSVAHQKVGGVGELDKHGIEPIYIVNITVYDNRNVEIGSRM